MPTPLMQYPGYDQDGIPNYRDLDSDNDGLFDDVDRKPYSRWQSPTPLLADMSVTALYKALLEANVSEDTAERAVEGLAMTTDVATKSDLVSLKGELKADIAQLETRLTWRLLGGVAVLLGLAVSIIKLI